MESWGTFGTLGKALGILGGVVAWVSWMWIFEHLLGDYLIDLDPAAWKQLIVEAGGILGYLSSRLCLIGAIAILASHRSNLDTEVENCSS